MSGYVNSWIESFTVAPTPCIKNVLFDGSTGAVIGDDGNTNVEESGSIFDALPTCAWWLIGGLVVGHMIKKSKRQ